MKTNLSTIILSVFISLGIVAWKNTAQVILLHNDSNLTSEVYRSKSLLRNRSSLNRENIKYK